MNKHVKSSNYFKWKVCKKYLKVDSQEDHHQGTQRVSLHFYHDRFLFEIDNDFISKVVSIFNAKCIPTSGGGGSAWEISPVTSNLSAFCSCLLWYLNLTLAKKQK